LSETVVAGEDRAYFFGIERDADMVTSCIPPFATGDWIKGGLTALLKPAECITWIELDVRTCYESCGNNVAPVQEVFNCQHQVAMNTKGKLTFELCWPQLLGTKATRRSAVDAASITTLNILKHTEDSTKKTCGGSAGLSVDH
jgi:hypothetical protein